MNYLKVKTLKAILEQFDDEASVCVWFKWNGDNVVDEAVSVSDNNGSVQINCYEAVGEE